ncbi:heme/hemin ABC transporter substrate-binding protein [Undibacter mobilis]|uniref:Hemin ABC transporter substrate-binding protein n=1 Tax=Undibacter mobilis TaxID=2292256 RepID=A0A371B7L7_9BRAD|nr:hemin ABC transporter substrate-binding protein [Undibacter mobilis]RDV03570.1 hemin ABC transporter substrate-binding protein [Undibacter mobilis]
MNCIFPTTRRVLIALGVLGVLAAPAVAETMVTDATGRSVTIRDTSRIVSIGGAVTEILYALGQSDKIVGIDTTSLFPPQAMKEKASVGYMRQLSAEGVLGLRPSLMIAIAGAGPKEAINVLEAAKVPLVVVPETFSIEGVAQKVAVIGKVVGEEARAQCIVRRLNADKDALTKIRAGIRAPKRVLFVLSFINGRAMAAGKGTAADGIIDLAGGVNVMSDYEGYKSINDEAVIAAKPDVILTMKRGGADDLTAETIFAGPAFQTTPAAATKAFVSFDAAYMLGFGPRVGRAARDVADALYPELKSAQLPSEQPSGPCIE